MNLNSIIDSPIADIWSSCVGTETWSLCDCIEQSKKKRKHNLWIYSIKPTQSCTWTPRAIQNNSVSIHLFRTWIHRFIHTPSEKYNPSSTFKLTIASKSRGELQQTHQLDYHPSISSEVTPNHAESHRLLWINFLFRGSEKTTTRFSSWYICDFIDETCRFVANSRKFWWITIHSWVFLI